MYVYTRFRQRSEKSVKCLWATMCVLRTKSSSLQENKYSELLSHLSSPCLLRWDPLQPRLASHSLCSWGWQWTTALWSSASNRVLSPRVLSLKALSPRFWVWWTRLPLLAMLPYKDGLSLWQWWTEEWPLNIAISWSPVSMGVPLQMAKGN